MADKNIARKMSDQNISGDSRNEDSTQKPAGRKSGEKPQRMMLYRPRSGMTLKRSEPVGADSWRNSKSPSPAPPDQQNKSPRPHNEDRKHQVADSAMDDANNSTPPRPRDVDARNQQNQPVDRHTDQPNYLTEPNRNFPVDVNCDHANEPCVDNRQLFPHANPSSNIDMTHVELGDKLMELTISTDQIIDLTLSSNPSSEEKKRVKKPEKALYVPKPMVELRTKIDWAAHVEEFEEEMAKAERENRNRRPKPKKRVDEKEDRVSELRNEQDRSGERDSRQGSEPRPPGAAPASRNPPLQRGRDSRSMEHSNWNEQQTPPSWSNHSKPPTSRKTNYEALPPRLKKKYMEEQGITDDSWDGGSLSFSSHHQHAAGSWTNTVPASRGRGRGRGRYDLNVRSSELPHDRWKEDSRRSREDINGRPEINKNVYEDAKSNAEDSRRPRFDEEDQQSRHGNVGPVRQEDWTSRPWADERAGSSSSRSRGSDDYWKSDVKSSDPDSSRSTTSDSRQPEPVKVTYSAPGLLAIHSTPGKKMDWSEIVEAADLADQAEMSRSSSLNSLTQHTFAVPAIPSKDRDKDRRHRRGRDRSESSDREKSSGARRGRRTSEDSTRDRNKGHYCFQGSSSRENSRERTDWRRGSGSGSGSGPPAPAVVEDSWRKSGSEERSWRSTDVTAVGSSGSLSASAAVNPAAASASALPYGIPARGFIQIQPTSQRTLFDPANPDRPIIINATSSRAPLSQAKGELSSQSAPSIHQNASGFGYPLPCTSESALRTHLSAHCPQPTDQILQRHPRHLTILKTIESAEMDLYYTIRYARQSGIGGYWIHIHHARHFLRTTLLDTIRTDLKFCLAEHLESAIWKSVYYQIFEMLKNFTESDPANKAYYTQSLLGIVEEGVQFFEHCISVLEEQFKFKMDDYASDSAPTDRTGYVNMAVNLCQKLQLCLGDLARYKEHACQGSNYGRAKLHYTKAQMLNPKNGRPYYQLGVIAAANKRKFEAMYYYMRSLMASTPMFSARESLQFIFDEHRKKLELVSRSKTDERVTEKELRGPSTALRREVWVHPFHTRRSHRTTSTSTDPRRLDSDTDDALAALTAVDINRRFTASFLHVHGKIFTKIGMETFQETAHQMLREFRVLLQQRPIPVYMTRLLQLTALNIFSIEHTKLKDPTLEPGYRSATQVNALVASLQMLNLMLERTLVLLNEQVAQSSKQLDEDLLALLPSIKVFCDWLLTHSAVWNPPPSCSDYRVGPPGDCWVRLAALVNFLEEHTFWKTPIVTKAAEDFERVRLPEDSALSGFSPLSVCDPDEVFAPPDTDPDMAQNCLRFRKILFFATEFLCGLEPPVLKLRKEGERLCYISVVTPPGPSPVNPADDDQSDAELVVESFSEGEEDSDAPPSSHSNHSDYSETQRLLHRKEVLERRQLRQEKHRRRVQAIIEKHGLNLEMEVRPRYLVPDTNCFIDYLEQLKIIAAATAPNSVEPCYTLCVPLIVVTELEGLSRGGRDRDMSGMSLHAKAHSMTVSEDARQALSFLRAPARPLASVRCVTTSGKIYKSFTNFTVDDENDRNLKNDDKILVTCLSLNRSTGREESDQPDEPRRVYRDVVLLTEDRHLRIKAHQRDVPVREVRDFLEWAGLG